jgi:transposase
MRSRKTVSAFNARKYDIFAGLDVDKRSIMVTFTNWRQWVGSLRIPYSSEHLLRYVRKHFPKRRIAFVYEAGPTGFGLFDDLTAKGHPCLVVAPSMVPRAPGQRVKTNRLDSENLSKKLRGGDLQSIHVPSVTYRELRHLVQLRDTHVRQVAATKCRIKSLLTYQGIEFPSEDETWSAEVVRRLQALNCSGAVRFKLNDLIRTLQFHSHSAADTHKELRRFCQNNPELKKTTTLLTSIPGIGLTVATHLAARLGDPQEITEVRQIAGFLGLGSSERSTGNHENRGPITRVGDSRLRNKLIQSAWVAIRKDPELKAFYWRIYRRNPKQAAAKKAIVAVARKLTTRIYAILKEQRPYVLRPDGSNASLTNEETGGPRGRLDAAQSDLP